MLAGFDEHSRALQGRIAQEQKSDSPDAQARVKDLAAQERCLAVTRGHYERYEKEKRFDAPGWSKDYTALQSAQ